MNPQVPTGSSGEVVREYYQHLFSHYLNQFRQAYTIHADVLLWFLFWFVILTAGFFAYTRWQRTTRASQEPYPVESYDGHIQEGNGPVGPFLTIFFIAMAIWLIIVTVLDLLNGQIY
ncbi:MAG: hypothetical protein KDE09_05630 [Anaerolineales bacterium]|nr:hypothetical protein [Anaerolineales bacterium]MCB0005547.1 hypothetical protein [Anaerolineales bacterium]MCB0017252.1 hypothetical protein [Anaerolineales bacterium]MCB0028193.1 hypothetical protein [Anaerolineales bacterium]MCB8961522.1 hypothetical protein [Ardenticatenales bacterium]